MNRYAAQRRRLVWLLSSIFIALAAASALIVTEAFYRLRFEAFHAQRQLAEELATRVDRELRGHIAAEEARPPTDYDFLVVSGERYVQRSPLSSLPPATSLPGVIGYFQVNASGELTTPLLPAGADDPDALDLTRDEFATRLGVQQELERLLQAAPRVDAQGDAVLGAARGAPAPAPEERDASGPVQAPSAGLAAEMEPAAANRQLFSQLSRTSDAKTLERNADEDLVGAPPRELRKRYESAIAASASSGGITASATARVEAVKQVEVPSAEGVGPLPRIRVFESTVDPFRLARLETAHLLLYRSVWIDDERLVQGAIIEQAPFVERLIGAPFAATSLAASSRLSVLFRGELLGRYPSPRSTASAMQPPHGELLLSTSLAAPASELQLVFDVTELPFGAGAVTLMWSTLVIVLALVGGFAALYWAGRRQIQLAEQQQDFVSAVSHELKTPLTSIRMYGEMLHSGWVSEEKRRVYYDYILAESERLSRMIGNVLELARIGRSRSKRLALEPIGVSTLLDELESRIATSLARAGLEQRRDYDGDAVRAEVLADSDAFLQVMINLVDNAIKFSAAAEVRAVEIGCRRSGHRVEFRVRDFGPGVAKGEMKKIFRLFYRTESELTRETTGTGIGLALVRELVERMRGTVDVVNRSPGAEFRVGLELADSRSDRDPPSGT